MKSFVIFLIFIVSFTSAIPFKNEKFSNSVIADLLPKYQGRIVGGEDTTIEKFPHQCSLRLSGNHLCGCAIVSPTIVITASHCKGKDYEAQDFEVTAGSKLRNGDKYTQTIQVTRFLKHPKYNERHSNNDIAIITLDEPLQLSDKVKPIALPKAGEMLTEGTKITVTGWGRKAEGDDHPLPDILQSVQIPFITPDKCSKLYSNRTTIDMLCAGYDNGGYDSCQGDSGGPLIANNKLYGVVSWGAGCARPNRPGVYARVSQFVDWIYENTDAKDWI